ncbi:DUF2695 domain-containing protein [Microlunatus soli]|uniref:DUF2695 domain-containing protein n=1 Tax=Microlunatus soli TaxID=630515 RepID=A0A1H1W145_9ACTN|nr:DUF2695 domain-containing protein [Microlunatus soli]SDS90421.1 Protein of unknown function [Microlunatus soli]
MTDTDAVVLELESVLRARSAMLVAARPGECVFCYVARMVNEFGCDTTLRWATGYRDRWAPRATGLANRLGSVGGYCDCEIFLNGYTLVDAVLVPRPLFPGLTAQQLALYGYDDPAEATELAAPDIPPPCGTVRRGSTQPCSNWRHYRRGE